MKLYSLKPLGLNTGLIESQTSYISRLAEAHCVSVGTLIGKEIAPIVKKEYLLRSTQNGGSRFYDFSIELNGFGKQAYDFAKVLSELTGINTISNLTLMLWNGVLPVKETLRRCKAWCPICLENWRNNNHEIYEPLIWNIKAVKICGIHGIKLKTKCPQCDMEIPVLSRKTRNGFCSFCGCWLGSNDISLNENIMPEQLSWECFVVTNIESLIKMGNELNVYSSDCNIHNFLETLISKVGGAGAFSTCFGIPVSTVKPWYDGTHKPLLYTLLKICFQIGINITDVFNYEQLCVSLINESKELRPLVRDESTDKISKKGIINWSYAENILKDIINCNNDIYYSVCEVAKNIGCSKRSLYRHFPDLCKVISERNKSYVKMMKKQRIEEGSKKITEATVALYNSGIYPSRRKVEGLLPPYLLLREKDFKFAWKDALKNLGLLS